MAWDWWSPLPVSTWWQSLNRLCSTWFRSLLFPFSCLVFVDESFRSSGTEMDRYEHFSRQILMWWKLNLFLLVFPTGCREYKINRQLQLGMRPTKSRSGKGIAIRKIFNHQRSRRFDGLAVSVDWHTVLVTTIKTKKICSTFWLSVCLFFFFFNYYYSSIIFKKPQVVKEKKNRKKSQNSYSQMVLSFSRTAVQRSYFSPLYFSPFYIPPLFEKFVYFPTSALV